MPDTGFEIHIVLDVFQVFRTWTVIRENDNRCVVCVHSLQTSLHNYLILFNCKHIILT